MCGELDFLQADEVPNAADAEVKCFFSFFLHEKYIGSTLV